MSCHDHDQTKKIVQIFFSPNGNSGHNSKLAFIEVRFLLLMKKSIKFDWVVKTQMYVDNANYNDYEDNLYNDNNTINVDNDDSNDDNKMKTIMIIKVTKMMTLRGRAQYPTPGQFTSSKIKLFSKMSQNLLVNN